MDRAQVFPRYRGESHTDFPYANDMASVEAALLQVAARPGTQRNQTIYCELVELRELLRPCFTRAPYRRGLPVLT